MAESRWQERPVDQPAIGREKPASARIGAGCNWRRGQPV